MGKLKVTGAGGRDTPSGGEGGRKPLGVRTGSFGGGSDGGGMWQRQQHPPALKAQESSGPYVHYFHPLIGCVRKAGSMGRSQEEED